MGVGVCVHQWLEDFMKKTQYADTNPFDTLQAIIYGCAKMVHFIWKNH